MVVYDLSEGISRRRHDDMTRGASMHDPYVSVTYGGAGTRDPHFT